MSHAANPVMPSDGVISFADGAGTPLTATALYEEGNFSGGPFMHLQREMLVFFARDTMYAAREGKQVVPKFTFTADLPGLTNATTKSLWDIVRRTGTFAAATGTLPASAGGLSSGGTKGIYTLSVSWTVERTEFGADADIVLTLKYCRVTINTLKEGSPGKIEVEIEALPYSTDWISVAG